MAVKRWAAVACGAALVFGACSGDDSGTDSSTTGVATTTASSTTSGSTTTPTEPGATTSTVPVPITAEEDPNETLPSTTLTPTTAAPTFEEKQVQELVQKGLEALPEGWVGSIADDLGTEVDSGFGGLLAECTGGEGYDLSQRDADSSASFELDASGPVTTEAGAPEGQITVEARRFSRASTADDAFVTLERAFTDPDAQECLTEGVPKLIAGVAPPESSFTAVVRDALITGADHALGLTVTLQSGDAKAEIYVDLAVSNLGDGVTILASFVSSLVQMDPEVPNAVYAAVVAA